MGPREILPNPAQSVWNDPYVEGFYMFLGHPDYERLYHWYADWHRGGDFTIADAVALWCTFGDGLVWCPTYIQFLEAIIQIAAISADYGFGGVAVEGIQSREEDGDQGRRICPGNSLPLAIAPNWRGEAAYLVNERTFERMKAAHAAGRPRDYFEKRFK